MAHKQRLSSERRWQIAGAGAVALVAVILCAAFFVAHTRPEQNVPVLSSAPLATQKPKKVVIIGDSYTEGTIQGGAGQNSWQQLSLKQLRIDGFNITSSVSGQGSAGYSARGYRGTNFQEEARRMISPDDDVVVVFGGLNDAITDPDAEATAVAATFNFIHSTAPKATIVAVGPVSPGVEPPPELISVRDTIKYEADKVGAIFVDPIADRWFDGFPDMIGADTLHPTDEGHKYMSAQLLPVLRKALTSSKS